MRLPRRTAVVLSVGTVALASFASACRPAIPPSERQTLAAAVGDTLPFASRLSGGFAPSKQGATRNPNDAPPALSPDARIAIAKLEKRAADDATPAALADLGIAYLIQGDADRAIATIEDAASQGTAAAPWSDLSAAHLVKAERTPERRVEYLAQALEAAERSLAISRSNDALFNRALARDRLAPYTGAASSWSEYAAIETDPAWQAAARRETENDQKIDDVRVRWESRRKELTARFAANDQEFIKETARLHPEAAIEILERELLLSEATLPQAGMLAAAIGAATGDPMYVDETAVVRAHAGQLVQAHQGYAKAATLNSANDAAGARQAVTAAMQAFSRANAPYKLVTEMRLAELEWREGRVDAAHRTLDRIAREARARGYVTLLGRVLMQQGLMFNSEWRLTDALAAFRESVSLFEKSGQLENATSVHSTLADDLRMLGESNESWASIGHTLENLTHLRRPIRRYLLLYNAALFVSRQGLTHAALIFQDAAVREAEGAPPGVLTEATLQRALVHARRGDLSSARADFDRAATQVAASPSGLFKTYMGAELEIVRAELTVAGAKGESSSNLPSAIDFFRGREPGRVPRLYLLQARTAQARGAAAEVEPALRQGIESLETQQAGLGDETLKISYFDEAWTLFPDMVSLQLSAHDQAKAFEYAERSRARTLLAATQGATSPRIRSLPEIQSELPASVALLHYTTLSDRVLIWTVTSASASLIERPIGERDLSRLVERHRESIRSHRDSAANDRLYELLIGPVTASLVKADIVVIVPDGQLQQLPFATLREPATRRYLIEDHALMVTPSANFFVQSRAASARMTTPLSSALLVGNPAASGSRPLPGAEAEVAQAAKLYARTEVLIGTAATKDRFLRAAPGFDVIHFGGHALANPEFPLLSRLVFADQGDTEQALFAHEIGRLRFPRTRVVVLAACSTAAGLVSRGEGVVSVARPFLSGGVPLVIASQWDVDDRATEQLTLVLHRELAKSGDPIHALQAAQLALLRSGDAVKALPESWGAFVAVGTAAR